MQKNDTQLSAEERKLVDQIQQLPLDKLNYTIIPITGGGTIPQHDFIFKMIVIGDSAIGKSCLMHRMCHNEFTEDHEVTVGVEFGSLLIKIKEVPFKLQIWDTAGQESFQSITKIFYRGAHAVLLTYDLTNMNTFNHLLKWLKEVRSQAEPDSLIFLVANKKDKESDREVAFEKGESFAQEHKLAGFFETSARTGENVENTFVTASKQLFKQHYAKIRESQLKMLEPKNKKLKQRQ